MKNLLAFASALAVSSLALAQDSYWIANRASSDIMRVSAWGSVLERVATPTTLRSCHTAPDGKVWIVRFIQATVDIYDPVSATFASIVLPSGSGFQIAFDANGHAWITNSATQVHEYDAAGVFVASYTTAVGSALGITVDAGGNKWIAHRATPASVSQIDPLGNVTNFLIAGATAAMLPTAILADFRGLLNPSHIWVVGDSASDLAELDATGATLNVYPMPATNIGSLTFDASGNIWVGSFGSGALMQVDQNTGTVLNNYTYSPSVNGLTTDHYGRLLASARVTFSGVGPPCELRRIDPGTGVQETQGKLAFGGFAAAGTQSAASSMWQYSLVVAPTGDIDGDTEINFAEIMNGTSPVDASSTSTFRQESFAVTQNGSTGVFQVQTPLLWIVGYATSLFPPTPVPGFGGLLRIDPGTLALTSAGVGNTTLPIAIPANPGLIDFEFFTQGVTFNGAGFDFQNVSGMKVW